MSNARSPQSTAGDNRVPGGRTALVLSNNQTVFTMTKFNVLGVYHLASAGDRAGGSAWYNDAYSVCDTIAAAYGAHVNTVAGVVAALSPRNRWSRNIADAENLVKLYAAGGEDAAANYKVCTFASGKKKALQILADGITNPDAIRAILNGPKLQEFFTCIVDDRPDVCIDGHAYAIWVGERITLADVPPISKKLRETIKADYIEAADILGVSPSTLQAITWVTWRRLHGLSD